MEDRLLVFRSKRGSGPALRRIYEKYRDYLLVLAVAISHDTSLSEDAVQDVFVAFVERLEKFNLTGSLKAYLATCVANRVRDLLRNRRGKVLSLDVEGDCRQAAVTDEPDKRMLLNEELQHLSTALAALPYEQREVVVLRIHGRMPFRAIAESSGISVNTAKGRFRYGIDKLRAILNSKVGK